ncbi:hypothetical protein C4K18_2906 [Pseudomonas chlororaphis subsp. aurantiaca]|nr:hypothetical protein C4K18_2906 [Pseudomonas chlororaphis subsp. aurantiaca]
MPDTFDSTWRRLSACCSWISLGGTTVMVCGVSSSGATYLAEAERSVREPGCSASTLMLSSCRDFCRSPASATPAQEARARPRVEASKRCGGSGDGAFVCIGSTLFLVRVNPI